MHAILLIDLGPDAVELLFHHVLLVINGARGKCCKCIDCIYA